MCLLCSLVTYLGISARKSNMKQVRCPTPKYENGFKHLWHLESGWAMNTNDENL